MRAPAKIRDTAMSYLKNFNNKTKLLTKVKDVQEFILVVNMANLNQGPKVYRNRKYERISA